jgi:Flp pilus assembly pilin Flp
MKIFKLRLFKNDKGASAVEFALILPILVTLVFGIFQFGIAFNNKIALNHAANVGARLAAVGQYDPQIVIDSAPSGMIQGVDANPDPFDPNVKIGDFITVTVTGSVLHVEIPFVNSWDISQISTATMRKEY